MATNVGALFLVSCFLVFLEIFLRNFIHQGTHTGRVAVRTSGSFRVGTRDGIAHRHCAVVQRADGYDYHTRKEERGFLHCH